MGSRGPQRQPTAALALRGSRLAKRRSAAPKSIAPLETFSPRRVVNLADTIRLIPGYDPHRDAAGCVFDVKAAAKAIRFIEGLRHVKGEKAGKPFWLEDWQRAIVGNLFGWMGADGRRRYRECFLFVPRKNGKTPLAAAIILYLLFEDGEAGAEVYGAASEFNQATLVFQHAAGMVRQSPELSERCKLYTGQAKSIQVTTDWSTYRVVSREASSQHGFNTHGFVIDEVHCLDDSELIDTFKTSMGARRQPLGLYISTSDYERTGSPCNEMHDYAVKVRDGTIAAPRFLPVIYEADKDADWTDPIVWAKANPNLGVSISREYLEDACRQAQETIRFENVFKRLHLNIRTEQDVRFLSMDDWRACSGELEIHAGEPCFAGLDLANTTDVGAFVLVCPKTDGRYAVRSFFWVPAENAIEREKRDRVPYTSWRDKGLVQMTEGNSIDYKTIRRTIGEIRERFNIQQIGVDPWNSTELQGELMDDGFEVVKYSQSIAAMTAPTKELERLVVSKQLHHGGNAVLSWMASNLAVRMDAAGNVRPAKDRSREKIDGMVALIMAIGLALVDRSGTDTGLAFL